MKFNKDLAAVHGYLCGDGYVIRNPESQKHKYYHIGFRNTNITLLKNFQECFENYFGVKPIVYRNERTRIQNKRIYFLLTENYSYYSYEWQMPNLSKKLLKFWLRSFFDCEGWVENQPAKSRLIGLECCNEEGILQIQKALSRFGIKSKVKKKRNRIIWRITICGRDNIRRYQKEINFFHPKKREKLREALKSYRPRKL